MLRFLIVIVSVVISLIGTWTVLEESKNVTGQTQTGESTVEGKVSISIIEQPKMPKITGKVSLTLIDNPFSE